MTLDLDNPAFLPGSSVCGGSPRRRGGAGARAACSRQLKRAGLAARGGADLRAAVPPAGRSANACRATSACSRPGESRADGLLHRPSDLRSLRLVVQHRGCALSGRAAVDASLSLRRRAAVLLLAVAAGLARRPTTTTSSAPTRLHLRPAALGLAGDRFLTGWMTGPRATVPAGARGWARFGLALQAILYHELAAARERRRDRGL